MVSRFGDDTKYREESAKMLATFLHLMQGTPFIYQGEEIGMTNVRFATIEDYKDIETLNMVREKAVENGEDMQKVMRAIHMKGRDNARTPVQWDDTEHAGFTTGTPWISVNPNYKEVNVKQALLNPNSVFHYYKKLIRLRKQHEIIVYGTYDLILENHEQIYAYTRTLGDEKLVVICNFFNGTPCFELPTHLRSYKKCELMVANYEGDGSGDIENMVLRPYEARVYRLVY
jgi:oligo-1,6-glucosidase